METKGKSDEKLVCEAILGSYNIMEDDRALRSSPASFEQLRNHYGIRREFEAFSVVLECQQARS